MIVKNLRNLIMMKTRHQLEEEQEEKAEELEEETTNQVF